MAQASRYFHLRTFINSFTPCGSLSPPIISPLSAALTWNQQYRSSKFRIFEIDSSTSVSQLTSSDTEEDVAGVSKKVEDFVHRVMIQKSTPDWLPFVPGSSFWVPPYKLPINLREFVLTPTNRKWNKHIVPLSASRGWPSSTFFIRGSGRRKKKRQSRARKESKLNTKSAAKARNEGDGKVKLQILADSETTDDTE